MIGWHGVRSGRHVIVAATAVGGLAVAFFVLPSNDAQAHGTMQSPPSRTYTCRFLDNPEAPSTDACKAAVAARGTQPVYDWNEVNLPDVAGRHREIIPDGRLCSAGRDKYRGFDLARADWPATRIPAGGSYTFRMLGTAPHMGTVDLYLTRNGYDPSQPLRWSDLDSRPFVSIRTSHDSHGYQATAPLPMGRTGRHLIYAIWQRTDSPEAFYSCSDVLLGGSGTGTSGSEPTPGPTHDHADHETPAPTTQVAAATVAPTHGPHPTPDPPPPTMPATSSASAGSPGHPAPPGDAWPDAAPAWRPYVGYSTGVLVSYGGEVWECVQSHFALPGGEPDRAAARWRIA